MNNRIFSKEAVNAGRQNEFDWAKAFAIIWMVIIHVYERMSTINTEVIPDSAFRIILEFLAGPAAAPVFMFSMGVGMVYSRHSTSGQMAIRGVKLLRNAYLLNFFKGFILLMIGYWLGQSIPMPPIAGLLYVDILQFAGCAFLTIALMKKLRFSLPVMVAATFIFQILGQWIGGLTINSVWLRYLLAPFALTHEYSSFPLFLWLFYPVAGMVFANVLMHVKDKGKFYGILLGIGVVGLTVSTVIYRMAGIDIREMFMVADKTYYKQTFLHYIWTTFVIMIVMAVCYFLSAYVKIQPVLSAVKYMGSNLNIIYVIQWLLVCYLLAAFMLIDIPLFSQQLVIPAGIAILGISIIICEIYKRWVVCRQAKKKGNETAQTKI